MVFKELAVNLCVLLSYLFIMGRFFKMEPPALDAPIGIRVRLGVLLGGLGIILIVFSIPVTDTVKTDLRHVVVVLAAVYGGMVSALVSAVIIAIGRLTFFDSNIISFSATAVMLMIAVLLGSLAKVPIVRWKAFQLFNGIQIPIVGGFLWFAMRKSEVLLLYLQTSLIAVVGGSVAFYILEYILESNRLFRQLRISENNYKSMSDRYRSVVDHVKEVIFQTDEEGRWTFLNPAWTEITGFTVGNSLQMPVRLYIHPEDALLLKGAGEGLSGFRVPWIKRELRIVTADGDYRWVEWFAQSRRDEENRYAGTLGTLMDITERRRSELKLAVELELSKRIQQSVLPKWYEGTRLNIHGKQLPSEQLAGDMYTWHTNGEKCTVILIDVMGHSVASSLVGMHIHSFLQELLTYMDDPAAIMKRLNYHVHDLFHSKSNTETVLCTALCVTLDTRDHTVRYVNAGHPHGIALTDEGQFVKLDRGGITLGIVREAAYHSGHFKYGEHCRLLMYTDGLFEVYKGRPGLTTDAIRNVLTACRHGNNQSVMNLLDKDIQALTERPDDICLVCLDAGHWSDTPEERESHVSNDN
ncbi:hypothetical protein SY83_08490 [Paenibacillus swuensis]|uniref:PAS domain-containing protein n=1 Tax=Paenibacillus swuensis TaxID=1178515 RepID=A0A172TGX2_9BACL|nr:SpoIIE family protein phosphatase [Paenibacillus swuensis]ANE46308.1 hypothetical protein SY83_08490 [Paenibacillus swuensis]